MSCWIFGRADLRRMQRTGFRAQHRMPHARDLQNRHMRIICGTISRADDRAAVPLLPGVRRHARAAPAESGRSGAARLHAPAASCSTWIRKLQSARSSRTEDDRIVLVRRAIEPGYGLWVFPGGYVDRGETVTAAALRETREEAGLDVRLDGLVNIYSYPGRPIIIIVYTASILGGELRIDEESLEARLFTPEDIPWTDLAFVSTRDALKDFMAGRTRPL